jgi:hypothetical protein
VVSGDSRVTVFDTCGVSGYGRIMNYYIATAFANIDGHNHVRDALGDAFTLTYDWTLNEPVEEGDFPRLREIADLEALGVRTADFVIVLLPGGTGTHAELGGAVIGGAVMGGKQVYLLDAKGVAWRKRSDGGETCIFYHSSLVLKFDDVEELIYHVKNVRKLHPGGTGPSFPTGVFPHKPDVRCLMDNEHTLCGDAFDLYSDELGGDLNFVEDVTPKPVSCRRCAWRISMSRAALLTPILLEREAT